MSKIKRIKAVPFVILGVLLLASSFFMFDFYMCLSGFIANKFSEPLVMIPIVASFLVPVIAALVAIYHLFVRELGRVAKIIASSLMAVLSLAAIALVLVNIPLYIRNHALGAYSSTLGIFLFPYDTIIANLVVSSAALLGIISGAINGIVPPRVKNFARPDVKFKLCIPEYIAFSVLAIVVFVFVGAGISGIGSIANALYDVRYLFLLVWVGIIPIMNLATFVIKPERMKISKWCRTAILSSLLLINCIIGALLLIFELFEPGFMIHIGKPLFMIAFSVSIPIEMFILFGIMLLSVLMISVKLIIMHLARKERVRCSSEKCSECNKCQSV